MKKISIALAMTLSLLGIQGAQAATFGLNAVPYVCNTTDGNENAGASVVSIPGRGGHTFLFTLQNTALIEYVDFPGAWIINQDNLFVDPYMQNISFAANPITNDVRVGPHVVGVAQEPGGTPFYFDQPAGAGTVGPADSFGFKTVSFTRAQLGLDSTAQITVLTITIAGAAAGKVPLSEYVDSIVIDGRAIGPTLTGTHFVCPVTPPQVNPGGGGGNPPP